MFLLLDKGFSKGTILFCQFALLLLSFIFISFIFVNNIEEKIPSPLHIVLSYGTFLLKSEVYSRVMLCMSCFNGIIFPLE